MSVIQNSGLVSVIMSVYNGEKFLRRAMDSILCQTYEDFEFIIVNDGSVDHSEAIIKSYTDKRIVFINNKVNKGLIASLNSAIALAKGQLIARMDSDDIAMPSRLALQVSYFQKQPEMVVLGSAYQVLKNNRINGLVKGGEENDYLKSVLLFSTCFAHPTVMIKNVFAESGIDYETDFVHAEDFRLWTRLASKGGFYTLPEPLLQYRHHPAQVSTRFKEKQLLVSSEIRKAYLLSVGFTFNEAQLQIHNLIGNNEFIKSKEQLIQIEGWLIELIRQNENLQAIGSTGFKSVIQKYWLDSCGHSNLGLKAFVMGLNSELSSLVPLGVSDKLKLLVKCLWRWFK